MTNPPKKPAPPATAAELFLMAAAAAAGHRDWVAAEGPGGPDARAADAKLADLARDGRMVLLVVALARRVARLEAAVAAAGGAV